MQSLPFRGEKGIALGRGLARFRGAEGSANAPAPVIEPGTRIRGARRPQPVEVDERALEPDRGGMPARRPKGNRRRDKAGSARRVSPARLAQQRHAHAGVVAPQADQRRFARREPAAQPRARVRSRCRRRLSESSHRRLLIATSPRRAGTTPPAAAADRCPASSTRPRCAPIGSEEARERRVAAGRLAERHALHPQHQRAEGDEQAEHEQHARAPASARRSR